MDDGSLGLGAVLADIGANMVTVLLVLFTLALGLHGQARPAVPQAYPAQPMPTLSGQAQSDLLFQRLNPPPDTLLIEVPRQGPVWMDWGRARPMGDLPDILPRRAVIFVFSAVQYAPLRDGSLRLPAERVEMTVPQALQRSDGAGFSDAFLSIRTGAEPASIRPELKRLLMQGGQGARTALTAMDQGGDDTAGGPRSLARLASALRLAGNLTLLGLTLWVLRGLWRRTRPAL